MKSSLPKSALKHTMRLAKLIYLSLSSLICLAIVAKSMDYWQPDFSLGFLIGKAEVFHYYQYFLYAHIIGAPIAFLSGLFQVFGKKSGLHRKFGYLYVFSVVFMAAPGGLGMAFFALGGFWSQLSFFLLSLLWLYFTIKALSFARKAQLGRHRKFMNRSFILANSAILIRIFSFVQNQYIQADPVEAYLLISWLSWLPWLMLYEAQLYLRSRG